MINELKRPDVMSFIKAHEKDDPAALVLQLNKYPNLPIKLIAGQIQSRQKARSKLPTLYQNDSIIFPHGVSMEQCSSEVTAIYKSELIQGKTLTDLTGGFGIDTYFFSKKLNQVNYIEQNKELCQIAKSNFSTLQANNISVFHTTSENHLSAEQQFSDCYFIDPARRSETNQKVFQIEDCQPNVQIIVPEILKRKAKVLIKFSPLLDIQQTISQLPFTSEIHVVSVKNECKELIFLLDSNHSRSPKIIATNITEYSRQILEFSMDEEKEIPQFSMPKEFIYEPNASIMKSGGFNSVANRFNLKKLHRNSHLYTSEKEIESFPGRVFRLNTICAVNKKKLKKILPEGKANITTRNYPDSVKDIRKKTGIKEGGGLYLFGTTLMDGSAKMLVCQKV